MCESELTYAVATSVLGWKLTLGGWHDGEDYTAQHSIDGFPTFGLSWHWAGVVINHMKKRGWDFTSENRNGYWIVDFNHQSDSGSLKTIDWSDDSFPRAVFTAAYNAVNPNF